MMDKYTFKELIEVLELGAPDPNSYSNWGTYHAIGERAGHAISQVYSSMGTTLFKLPRTPKQYDNDANDVMIRIIEPILFNLLALMKAHGMREYGGQRVRKSRPAKSQLRKAYAQYTPYDQLGGTPWVFYHAVKDALTQTPGDPLALEKGYVILAEKEHSGDVAKAKARVRKNISDNYALSRVRDTNRRNKYEYILHPDLDSHTMHALRGCLDNVGGLVKQIERERGLGPGVAAHVLSPEKARLSRLLLFGVTHMVYKYWQDLRAGRFKYE